MQNELAGLTRLNEDWQSDRRIACTWAPQNDTRHRWDGMESGWLRRGIMIPIISMAVIMQGWWLPSWYQSLSHVVCHLSVQKLKDLGATNSDSNGPGSSHYQGIDEKPCNACGGADCTGTLACGQRLRRAVFSQTGFGFCGCTRCIGPRNGRQFGRAVTDYRRGQRARK